jgi:two-component system response regulator AtoC
MPKRILIVDDEPSIRMVLRAHLTRSGYDVTATENGAEAIAMLRSEDYHLVVSDLKMPIVGGMELLNHCNETYPGLPVILITAHGTVDSAVEAIKKGAQDYVTKPFDSDELMPIIEKALRTEEKGRTNLHEDAAGRFKIIGQTARMHKIYALIEKVARSPTTALITGESGTGKELVARALHEHSDRMDAPFIQVNCGAIPESLFESELFGHEKGAFTGAVASKPGKFELADGGTLFLDEVGELPKDMQVKLLRVLQDGQFERVGGVRSMTVDVRLIAATNRVLETEVKEGRFREDLFYRLNVIPIQLPPLRERADDIPLLVEHFIAKFNKRLNTEVEGVSPDAIAALLAHSWPGNIRELENLIERSVLLTEDTILTMGDLPGLTPTNLGRVEAPPDAEEMGLKEYVRVYTTKLERARIQRVLEEEDSNVTRASKKLGISRKSLQMKMKDYGLRDADKNGEGDGEVEPEQG